MENGLQLKKGRDSSFDKIFAFYKNPEKYELTTKQITIKNRWLAAWTLRLEGNTPTKAAEKLQEVYKEEKLSRAQAFRDVQNSEKLYGSIINADRTGRMAIHYEYALDAYNKSMEAKDFKAAKGFLAEMRESMPFEDSQSFNPEKLENKPVKLTVENAVEQAIKNHLKTGVLDFNTLEVEDVNHEDITDE
ncbi:hypothetical protein G1K66_08515 [Tenacibaculum finnmarkense]|uniref:hypothetical protein n=1 Tax=Tenacibaculum finnmarkense TaxID=2781243 RepID=UPI00187B18A9|nr:hypothetical protein [Tenacibaculum finnmarkense]MBE7688450.1 hypothetical protein [Tenacibaculum finnmarkense genomovar ulcerans]MCD8430395.1 hypothetical protein [Tenacibaculum finnmarkense genomovar ulcerans]MCG8813303.1 hypothetical protein [Tenacibaculum finnmarkense]